MIFSMTGYGSAQGQAGSLAIQVELKAVNNRYLDVSVRLPRLYLFAEEKMKKLVSQRVARGKVDIFVNIESKGEPEVEVRVNENLAQAYFNAIGALGEGLNISNSLDALQLARMPEVLQLERKEEDAEEFEQNLLTILEEAVSNFKEMRRVEGEKLKEDIRARLAEIKRLSGEMKELSPKTVTAYREKLEKRMSEVLEGVHIEESRILTEAAIFADRVAIDEEITRLDSHMIQLQDMLEEGGAIGRKLDFLLQEFGREANTIGSKCNDLEIGKLVIALKAEIEKIREQVQNIE